LKIDCEGHFWTEEFVSYMRERTDPPRQEVLSDDLRRLYYDASTPELIVNHSTFLETNLLDLDRRIELMDKHGIAIMALSHSGPSVEQFAPADSLYQAKASNDVLAEYVKKYPDRYIGLVTIAPALPEESAAEIERCVTEYGFRGVNVMSHLESDDAPYLDDRRYRPIFEACERLGVPINLHPTVPHSSMIQPYLGYGWALPAPGLGFGHETAVHTMRLIYSGLFDEYPNLQMMLGHFGEALTFWFYRIDFDFIKPWLDPAHRPKIDRKPSDYLKTNFWLNSSGNFLNSALASCILEVGTDRLMFASDYPWETIEDATSFMEKAPLADVDREKLQWRNAARMFGLDIAALEQRAAGE
jgi:predicted TIM-barrel fold metal-dependent hydrolase